MTVSGTDLMSRLETLATYSDESDALTRTYLSPAHKAAGNQIRVWMEAAGMQTRIDAAANVIGRYEGNQPGMPALLTGSHFDTVRNAGKYDGSLGVLAGIACVDALNRQQKRMPFAIEVVAFSEEEGVRYNATLLGSRAIANTFDQSLLESKDADSISMLDALLHYGLGTQDITSAAYNAHDVIGYIELHIEQGPVLLDEDLPVGIVTAIAGATRYKVGVTGRAGHAGTVPMSLRQDSAAAAAEAVLLVEQLCKQSDSVVGTVGQLIVPDGSANVIAGAANFSIDIRSGSDSERLRVTSEVLAGMESIAKRRNVKFDAVKTHDAPAATCSDRFITQLHASIERTGLRAHSLLSGAGHDAMAIAALTDIAMLFVRCGNGGISHHPLETISAEDAVTAADVLLDFILNFEA